MPKNTPERIIDYPASNASRATAYVGGATSTATTLADHDHGGGLGSGGTLTGYAASSHTHLSTDITDFAADVVVAILAGDGPGSGIDADTLDGVEGAGYALDGHTHGATGRWEPLTNGDAGSPEILFLDGDVIMLFVED